VVKAQVWSSPAVSDWRAITVMAVLAASPSTVAVTTEEPGATATIKPVSVT
jgi:hypothetical protein